MVAEAGDGRPEVSLVGRKHVVASLDDDASGGKEQRQETS